MWYDIFKFELRYRSKRADTYVFFTFLFLFATIAVDFVFQGVEFGYAKKNAPLIIAKTMGVITGLFMILASMVMGVPILRDFQYQIAPLLFTAPIKKRDYLIGRFLGSFVVLIGVFSSVFLGMIVGEFMPWQDADAFTPFTVFPYLKAFFIIVLPMLFFGAALFFTTGALTKKLAVVYTQGIVLFVVFVLTKAITNETLQAILDPFSLTTLTLITNEWTIAQKSVQGFPVFGVILYNKLFWTLLGMIILIYGYQKFNFDLVKGKGIKNSLVPYKDNGLGNSALKIPWATTPFDFKSNWIQFIKGSWFYFISICKQPSFWAIVICGMVIILINSVNLGTVHGVDSYPTTYLIVEELQETSIYFFIIVLIFYSGELIWKERDTDSYLIYDATPISPFVHLLSKYVGLNFIYVVLIIALIISGIIFQTVNGYYTYEFHVYFYGFFLEILPFLALFTCITFFIQAMVNNKFVGILLTVIFCIGNAVFANLGFGHELFFFGGSPLGGYSQMNGYGHFLMPYLLVKSYWSLFSILLLMVASLVIVKGVETNFIRRLKIGRSRLKGLLAKAMSIVLLAAIALGSFIFYNTNVLNRYWTNAETTAYRVAYEKQLKQYEFVPQPKLTAVNLQLELYPKTRDYIAAGHYTLTNTTDVTIAAVHIQKLIEDQVILGSVSFEGGATVDDQYQEFGYSIFHLKSPLKPGDSVKMYFKQGFETKGFAFGNSNTGVHHNGTFLRNTDLPTIGYNKKYELQDDKDREDHKLPVRYDKAAQDNEHELKNARSGGDSDGIDFEMIVGTSMDQTALVPGNLVRQWTKNRRNYFHYKMNRSIINFYSIVSANYEVKTDEWTNRQDTVAKPVALEIYHHKDHTDNLDRMMQGMKASLSYYSKNFGPYQYKQLRIMEFPRYGQFAQSFPGTIPFSESIGFILDIDDEKDVDMAFFITAHEVAHQWFGMQVEAANVKGKNFILETLSQYAAMMVLRNQYSEEKLLAFLTLQEEAYKKGKEREFNEEPSLVLVENQDYVYYAKGAIAIYEFQKEVGEEAVNKALRDFLADWNTSDGRLKTRTDRYATSKDLLEYLIAVTPEDIQDIVYRLFQTNEAIVRDK